LEHSGDANRPTRLSRKKTRLGTRTGNTHVLPSCTSSLLSSIHSSIIACSRFVFFSLSPFPSLLAQVHETHKTGPTDRHFFRSFVGRFSVLLFSFVCSTKDDLVHSFIHPFIHSRACMPAETTTASTLLSLQAGKQAVPSLTDIVRMTVRRSVPSSSPHQQSSHKTSRRTTRQTRTNTDRETVVKGEEERNSRSLMHSLITQLIHDCADEVEE